jgi:hypothetical protein
VAAAGGAPVFALDVVAQQADPEPGDAVLLASGPLPEAPGLPDARLFDAAGGLLLVLPGRLSLRLAASGSAGVMGVAPGAEALVGGSAGLYAIEAAAALSGQALVHAGALSLPGHRHAILLAAPSGAGKTTTAMALALGGFGLLTDDAAMLRAEAGAATVWGLRRAVKLHRQSLALLPALAPIALVEWDAAGEQALTLPAIATLATVPPPRPLPVTAILLLGPRAGGGAHALRQLPRAEMLLRLAADNLGRGPRGLPGAERRRWAVLGAAAATARAFELTVGIDLQGLAPWLQDALATSDGAS